MKLILGLATVIGAALATGAAAQAASTAAQGPWCVSVGGGGYFREGDDGPDTFHHLDAPTTLVTGTDKRNFDAGETFAFALGYRVAPHIRIEGEFDYVTYTGSSLRPATTAPGFADLHGQAFDRTSGDRFSRYEGTVNAFYDFNPIAGRFTPYVGAGIGASSDHQNMGDFKDASGVLFTSSGGSSTQGLALVEGGVAVALTPSLSLVPAYRYTRFFADQEDVAHTAKVSLRYSF